MTSKGHRYLQVCQWVLWSHCRWLTRFWEYCRQTGSYSSLNPAAISSTGEKSLFYSLTPLTGIPLLSIRKLLFSNAMHENQESTLEQVFT